MRRISVVVFLVLVSIHTLALGAPLSLDGHSCIGLSAPIDGEITRDFAPVGRYAGHWGVDYSTSELDAAVRAAASGTVTFTGVVVGNRTVTLDHGGGLKTSYSFIADAVVRQGQWVQRGSAFGIADPEGEHGALHFSVRIDGVYLDPAPLVGCRSTPPSDGLSLVRPP